MVAPARLPSMVRFSIVTPVRNGMPWLPETVESVARQLPDVEVEHIVLDGGSTDGSREWLGDHSGKHVTLIFEPDDGQTDALIKGFGSAGGDIFGWLNADDILEPGALQRVAAEFEAHPNAALVSGSALLIGPNGAIVGAIPTPPVNNLQELLAYPFNLAQPSTFFPGALYRTVGGLDRRFDLAMDVDLWMRLAALGTIATLPDVALSRFRIHPGAKSVIQATAAARQDMSIRRRHGMRSRSRAGLTLLAAAYVRPIKWWAQSAVRRLLRRSR
jgi:glycosyltransferase involved in cell wall biosynthesis